MKTYFTVSTSILWKQGENYKRNTYHYNTKEEQTKGFEKISDDLTRLIKEKKILDFMIEM